MRVGAGEEVDGEGDLVTNPRGDSDGGYSGDWGVRGDVGWRWWLKASKMMNEGGKSLILTRGHRLAEVVFDVVDAVARDEVCFDVGRLQAALRRPRWSI